MSRTLKTTTCKPTITKNLDPPSTYKSTIEDAEDPKEQDEHSKEMETKVLGRRKQVWKPRGNLQWKENTDVDPDEVVQVEGIHT